MRITWPKLLASVLGVGLITAPLSLAGILYNPVVTMIGNGSASVTNQARPTTIRIYQNTTAAQSSPISELAYNSGATGTRLTNTISATSEGLLSNNPALADAAAAGLTYSGNAYIFSAGYDAASGTASVLLNAANAPRVVGYMSVNGSVLSGASYSATSTTPYSNSNFRSAVGDDTATNYWTGGDSTTTANNGWRYFPTVKLETTDTNVRDVEILNGQLFGTTGSGTTRGIYTIGTGVPTTAGTDASFVNTGSSALPDEFVLINDPNNSASTANTFGFDTAYIADDRSRVSGGGIQKWTWDGSLWSLAYTLSDGVSGNRGLAGQLDPTTGNVVLWATTTGQDKLEQVTDTGALSSFITLATAPTNDLFQGVALAPLPEPTFLGIAAVLFPLLAARRRRV